MNSNFEVWVLTEININAILSLGFFISIAGIGNIVQ